MFFERLCEYVDTCQINLAAVSRFSGFETLGLPSMRGFNPQTRTVNLYCDEKDVLVKTLRHPKAVLKDERALWLCHDILHIVYYDFVTHHLSLSSWGDDSRFFENHLASEALAVLSLDYHCLIHTPVHGLAVDLDSQSWARFQKKSPALPDLRTPAFCKALVALYLTGASVLTETKGQGSAFQNWLGHEVRYSEKQRHYVKIWHDFLVGKAEGGSALVENSYAQDAIWELVFLFHNASETTWRQFLRELKPIAKIKNHFDVIRKRKQIADFRFQNIESMSRDAVLDIIERADVASASSLFLFWQVVTRQPLKNYSKQEREQIKTLARASQTQAVSAAAWAPVQRLALEVAKKLAWPQKRHFHSTFFLP